MGKDSKESKKSKYRHDDDESKSSSRKSSHEIEKMAKLLGYSNEINPFGDSNLLQPFVWKKKNESHAKVETKYEDSEKLRLQTMKEIDRVRKRRLEKETEMQERERLRDEEQRLRELASFGDWKEKEEEFHIRQIRSRSVIRILESREIPVDMIARNIILMEATLSINNVENESTKLKLSSLELETRSPFEIISQIDDFELEDLEKDCKSYLDLEKHLNSSYLSYWDAVLQLVVRERKRRSFVEASFHKSIAEEVDILMKNKISEELDDLEKSINESIKSKSVRDRDYWEKLLYEIQVRRAISMTNKVHENLMNSLLDRVSIAYRESNENNSSHVGKTASFCNFDGSSKALALFQSEKDKVLREGEGILENEVAILNAFYPWRNEYTPIKPRCLNRVNTGFDWNKYNSTHYDKDNPPPRMILGYTFCIFYPELVDKTSSPRYFIEPTNNEDFVIIRFHAGAPYEDIAFKIVNKVWDTHPRSGFKCIFERDVLHLRIYFKKKFYRR